MISRIQLNLDSVKLNRLNNPPLYFPHRQPKCCAVKNYATHTLLTGESKSLHKTHLIQHPPPFTMSIEVPLY